MAIASTQRPRARLEKKYVLVIVFLVGGVLLASGLVEVFFSYQEGRNALANLERKEATFAAATIEQFMDGIMLQVGGVARKSRSLQRNELDDRRVDYLRLLNRVPAITQVALLDPDGKERIKVSRLSLDVIGSGIDRSGELVFQNIGVQDKYTSPVYFLHGSEPYLSIAMREPGQDAGFVVAEVNLKFIEETVTGIKVGKAGHAYVVDADGVLVAHPDSSLVLKRTDLSSLAQVQGALAQSALSGPGGPADVTVARNIAGQRVLTSQQRLPSLGWHVFVEQPLNEAFAPMYAAILRSAMLLVIGLGLATLTSIVLARRMVAPILALRNSVVRIGAGDLDQNIQVGTGDEVEELGDAFNMMTARLRATYTDLEYARDMAVEASRAKSDFLASMSHEIRTPMNAIIGMGDLLAEGELTADQQEYLRVSNNAGESLLAIINDILDISKVESGQLILEELSFDLGQLVEDTAESVAVHAHSKGLELNCRVRPEVPVTLVGDRGRLRQVLINLLGNAIKFTETGGISLEVENDPEVAQPGAIKIRVSDTGIGIPQSQLWSVFDSFSQVDSSTTRQYGGTGLGLSISRQLIELMGGHIWVESKIGEGSTFFFTARLQVQPETNGASELSKADLKGIKTLVVDDNADNRLILTEILTEWGASVTTVDAGYQCLAELARVKKDGERYDLVLLDSRMPGMDGFEVAERIQQKLGMVGMAIMMLTSDNRREDIPRCRQLGISQYLVKPVKRSNLYHAIIDALNNHDEPVLEPKPSVPDAPDDHRSWRILLVEDSKDNRFLIQSYLKDSSFEIEIAENGEIAVGKFMSSDYDLVLMDMQMPVMDGYMATKEIRKWEREQMRKPIPIVALTAHALKEDAQKSFEAGCDDHVTKPVKKSLLLGTINEHLGRG